MTWLNFSWIIEGKLAGHAGPSSEEDLLWLKQQGVLALVRMAEHGVAKVDQLQIKRLRLSDCHEPVADLTAPEPSQIDRMLDFIARSLAKGRPVGVSCGGGWGRTGTVLACYLVSSCLSAEKAIGEVRRKRPGSIQTEAQKEAVKAYAQRMGKQ